MTKFTDDELDGLSPQEREALAAEEDDANATVDEGGRDDHGDDTGNDGNADDDPGKTDDDAGNADDGVGATEDGTAQQDQRAGAEQDAGAQTQNDAAANEPPPFAPRYEAQLPEDFNTKMEALETRIAGLEAEYRDGNLSFDEFRAKEREVETQRQQLHDARIKAEISSESAEQADRQRWQWEVDRFLRDVKRREGIDYRSDENKALFADLDMMVKGLGANPANENNDAEWFFAEAHRRVKALHGLATTAPPSTTQQAAEDKRKAVMDERRQARPKANLGELAAAGREDESLGEGEFAYLDKLLGERLERAIAKLTPEQAARYLGED